MSNLPAGADGGLGAVGSISSSLAVALSDPKTIAAIAAACINARQHL
jgi:hypothetical protein